MSKKSNNNIVIVGMMGVGKSSVGKVLAKELRCKFFDSDNEIESASNLNISEIFEKYGEIDFRRKEHFYLEQIINSNNYSIISLGGGTPCYSENMKFLQSKANVKTFYLKVSAKNVSERLFKEREKRPLISHIDSVKSMEKFVSKHLFERMPYYLKSTHQIDTNNKSISEIAKNILVLLA